MRRNGELQPKILTLSESWDLVVALAEILHKELAGLSRDRATAAKRAAKQVIMLPGESLAGPFTPFFIARAQSLSCTAYHHYNPTLRPQAWVTVEFQLGSERRGPDGQSQGNKTMTVWAQLPSAHWSERVRMETTMGGEKVTIRPKEFQGNMRRYEVERMKARGAGWVPKPLPIDPRAKGTPIDVTEFLLLLWLWQEDMVPLDPKETPSAWGFLKKWLRIEDEGLLWGVLDLLRKHYVLPDDWRGLRKYLGRTIRSERRRGGFQETA